MSIYDTILNTNQEGANNQMMLNRLRLDPSLTPLNQMIATQGELQKQQLAKQNADLMQTYKMGYLQDLGQRRKEQFFNHVLPNVTPGNRDAFVAAAKAAGFSPDEAEGIIPKQQFVETPGAATPAVQGMPQGAPGAYLPDASMPSIPGAAPIQGQPTQTPIPGTGFGQTALLNQSKADNWKSLIQHRQDLAETKAKMADIAQQTQKTREDLAQGRINKMDADIKIGRLNAQAHMLSSQAMMDRNQILATGGDLFGSDAAPDLGDDETPKPTMPPNPTPKGVTAAINTLKVLSSQWEKNGRKGPAPTLADALASLRTPAAPPASPAVMPPTPAIPGAIRVGDTSPKPDGVYLVGTQKLTVKGGKVTKAE